MMRAALAARVSTRDKQQDPEIQLVPLREFAAARGWSVVDEYVDHSSASDFVRRTEWRRLQEDARRRHVDLVAVWKLDRAFRSAIECLNTLADWQARGLHFVCVSQPEIDTTTPIGRLLLTVLAAVAEFEKDLIRERVADGLANARRKGTRIGRPPALDRPGFADQWMSVRAQLLGGEIGKREAARRLAIGAGTLERLLAGVQAGDPGGARGGREGTSQLDPKGPKSSGYAARSPQPPAQWPGMLQAPRFSSHQRLSTSSQEEAPVHRRRSTGDAS